MAFYKAKFTAAPNIDRSSLIVNSYKIYEIQFVGPGATTYYIGCTGKPVPERIYKHWWDLSRPVAKVWDKAASVNVVVIGTAPNKRAGRLKEAAYIKAKSKQVGKERMINKQHIYQNNLIHNQSVLCRSGICF